MSSVPRDLLLWTHSADLWWLHFKHLHCLIRRAYLEAPNCMQWLLVWSLRDEAGFASFLFTILQGCSHFIFSSTCRNLKQSLTSLELHWVYTLLWQGKIIHTVRALLPAEILQTLIKFCSLHLQLKDGDIAVTAADLSNAVVHSAFCILFTGELKCYKFKWVAQGHTTKWKSLLGRHSPK